MYMGSNIGLIVEKDIKGGYSVPKPPKVISGPQINRFKFKQIRRTLSQRNSHFSFKLFFWQTEGDFVRARL